MKLQLPLVQTDTLISLVDALLKNPASIYQEIETDHVVKNRSGFF